MSYGFDTNFDASKFFPDKLRNDPANFELYPKVISMLNYIISNAAEEFKDIRLDNPDPTSEVIKETINELGFSYITQVMETLNNFEFNTLLEFVGVINLMKGSRIGLELILKLLGFDSVIVEWWEQSPKKEPQTFEILVVVNNSYVPDVQKTLEQVKIFAQAYVFPKISNIDFKYSLSFSEMNVVHFGFFKETYFGRIQIRAV